MPEYRRAACWAEYQKRVFLLSNLPVEMPVDHLIEFNDLMPDRLEMELIKKGDIPLTPLGLEKMRPDLELSKEAIKHCIGEAPRAYKAALNATP